MTRKGVCLCPGWLTNCSCIRSSRILGAGSSSMPTRGTHELLTASLEFSFLEYLTLELLFIGADGGTKVGCRKEANSSSSAGRSLSQDFLWEEPGKLTTNHRQEHEESPSLCLSGLSAPLCVCHNPCLLPLLGPACFLCYLLLFASCRQSCLILHLLVLLLNFQSPKEQRD